MAQQRKAKPKSTNSKSGGSPKAKRTAAAKKAAATRKANQQRRSAAARKGAAKRNAGSKPKAQPKKSSASDPLGLVILTRERIEDVVNDAVSRGRVTADDAQDLISGLVERGRRQTSDVLADFEQLLGRGFDQIEDATDTARKRGSDAATKARAQADPLLAQADKARRAAGLGPSFPITGYDDLTANQVQSRLDDLSPAELRKVRDYERRNANRKTVLDGISSRLD